MIALRNNQRGSVLLITLCFVAVLAIALTSYINLSSVTMNVSNRSYNTAVSTQVAEMGLERALQAFIKNDWSAWNTTTIPNTATLTITFPSTRYGNSGVATTINLQVNNYNAPTTAAAWNSGTSYAANAVVSYRGAWYSCIAPNINQSPTTGTTPPTLNATYWSGTPVIYSEGVAQLPTALTTNIRTQLRAVVASAPLFTNAIAGTSTVGFASSGTIDSYNRSSGTYASQVGTTSNYSAEIASPAVTISSAVTVQGYVSSPNFTYNVSNTVVEGPTSPTSPKVDPLRVSSSPYIPQFDPSAITSSTNITVSGSFGTINLPRGGDVAAADGKYYYYTSGNIVLNNGDTLNINDKVVIDVRPSASTGIQINNNGKIVVAATASSLEIHFGGQLYIGSSSGGGIQNLSLDPKKCVLISTSTYNTGSYHFFWSSIPFYGVIYMPYAYLTVWNSGYNTEIYGALSASNVYFQHAALLHYDTSLRNTVISGVDNPYLITEWRELTNPAEKIVFP